MGRTRANENHLSARGLIAGAIVLAILSTPALGRSIFLNGTDISNARSQTLDDVDIRIDEKGNLYISAPHYQVHQEETFVPLSRYAPDNTTMRHKGPKKLAPKKDETARGRAAKLRAKKGRSAGKGDPGNTMKPASRQMSQKGSQPIQKANAGANGGGTGADAQ